MEEPIKEEPEWHGKESDWQRARYENRWGKTKGERESLITDNGNANQKWAGIAETRTWLDEEESHDDYRDTKTRVEDTRRRYQVIVASLWRCYMHTVSRSLHFLNSAGVSRGAH